MYIEIRYITDFGESRAKYYEVSDECDPAHARKKIGSLFRKEYERLRKQKPNEGENIIDEEITEQSES